MKLFRTAGVTDLEWAMLGLLCLAVSLLTKVV
jgi:hypothetical protein